MYRDFSETLQQILKSFLAYNVVNGISGSTQTFYSDVLSALLVCLSVAQHHIFPDIAAIVNEPMALPCNCSGRMAEWTIFYPTKKSIAVCDHGKCRIEQEFLKRCSVSGNTSTGNFTMSINSILYNDIGHYRCTCDGKSVSEGKLNVYGKVHVRCRLYTKNNTAEIYLWNFFASFRP